MRVSRVEAQIASIRERIKQLEPMVHTDPAEVIRILTDITYQLQGTKSQVTEIQNLVRYK